MCWLVDKAVMIYIFTSQRTVLRNKRLLQISGINSMNKFDYKIYTILYFKGLLDVLTKNINRYNSFFVEICIYGFLYYTFRILT